MAYSPDDRELWYHDWFEERDKARETVFIYARTYLKWGQAGRIPANLVSSYLRCDKCREQASFVAWNRILYCDKHLRARNRKLTKTLKWRMKVREWQRIARDQETILKGL